MTLWVTWLCESHDFVSHMFLWVTWLCESIFLFWPKDIIHNSINILRFFNTSNLSKIFFELNVIFRLHVRRNVSSPLKSETRLHEGGVLYPLPSLQPPHLASCSQRNISIFFSNADPYVFFTNPYLGSTWEKWIQSPLKIGEVKNNFLRILKKRGLSYVIVGVRVNKVSHFFFYLLSYIHFSLSFFLGFFSVASAFEWMLL